MALVLILPYFKTDVSYTQFFYENSSYKSVLGLEWSSTYTPNSVILLYKFH